MLAPDKFTTFDESLLSMVPDVLSHLRTPMAVTRLRQQCHKVVRDPADFVLVLDILFVLGVIEVDFQTGEISRAG
jgi:hypothetical protein